ncbi:hypothetical protein Ga0100231_006250 [Opitutaceae bacterium TAV4]|nr:hypothetical protein Ga0100231_006250 [Opitutaceae bacterium TAV4]RRK02604.1 hypothetical protein Ga0100230_005675 [Opitutaceae bacterium TAV3]
MSKIEYKAVHPTIGPKGERWYSRFAVTGGVLEYYPTLFEAVRYSDHLAGGPIPTADAYPKLGVLADPYAVGGRNHWSVGVHCKAADDFTFYGIGEFKSPRDAFMFASAKQKADTIKTHEWFVQWSWDTVATEGKHSRYVILERLPATWLDEQWKAWDRAEKRRDRLARKEALAA